MSIYIFEEGIDRMGGVERIVSTLANEFIKTYDVNVVSLYKTRETTFFNYSENVNINYLIRKKRIKEKSYYSSKIKYYLTRIIEEVKDNTILKHKIRKICNKTTEQDVLVFGRVDVALKVLPYVRKKKKVIVRDAIHIDYQKKSIKNKIAKLFPNRVDLLIVSSDESIKRYKEEIDCGNINIKKIYNPLGIEPKIKNNLENKTIISVGRYSTQKGFENLINAFTIVTKTHPDWKLEIVGDNSELTNMVEDLGLSDKINLKGSSKNVVDNLNEASIFVMTSRYEGYANALVEALACGLPSISYDWLLGPDEIIKDRENGIIVKLKDRYKYANCEDDEENIENLAKAINILIENEDEYNRYAKNAPNIIESRKRETIISQWIEEIEK